MARTRAIDYEQKELTIMETAARLFSREGVERTSMAMIAAESGNSKAVLYHYYDSKENLLYDIVSRHLTFLIATVQQARRGKKDASEKLNAMARALVHAYQQNEDKHRIQLAGLPSLSPENHEVITDLQRKLVDEFAVVVEELLPDPSQKERLLKPVTMSLFGMMNWHYTWFRDSGPMTLDDYADLVSMLIQRGLTPDL